jgi:hypothetical protein
LTANFLEPLGVLVKLMLAVVFLALGSCSAFSAEGVAAGIGISSCGQFANEYKKAPDIETYYFYWAQGYMSAFNIGSIADQKAWRNLGAMTPEEQQRHLRSYCDKHPLGMYLDAVHDLLSALPYKRN